MMFGYSVPVVFFVLHSVTPLPLDLVFSQWDSTVGRCPSLYGTSDKPGLLGTFEKLKSTCSGKTGPLCAGVLGISVGVCEIHQQLHDEDIQTDKIRLPELPEDAGPEEICSAMVEPHLQSRLIYHVKNNVVYKTFKSKISAFLPANNTKGECVDRCSEPEVEGLDPDNFQEEDRIYLCKTALKGLQSLAAIWGPTPEEMKSLEQPAEGPLADPKDEEAESANGNDAVVPQLDPVQVKKSIAKLMNDPGISASLKQSKVGNTLLKLAEDNNDPLADDGSKVNKTAKNRTQNDEETKKEQSDPIEGEVNPTSEDVPTAKQTPGKPESPKIPDHTDKAVPISNGTDSDGSRPVEEPAEKTKEVKNENGTKAVTVTIPSSENMSSKAVTELSNVAGPSVQNVTLSTNTSIKAITPKASVNEDDPLKKVAPPPVHEEPVVTDEPVTTTQKDSELDDYLKDNALIPGEEEEEKLEEEREENVDDEVEKQLENQDYEDRNLGGILPEKMDEEVRYKTKSSSSVHYYEENMEESNFMTMLLTFVALTLLGYLAFHNKHRIIAVMIEGRRRRPAARGRFANTSYKKLDSSFDDALSSSCRVNRSDVIY